MALLSRRVLAAVVAPAALMLVACGSDEKPAGSSSASNEAVDGATTPGGTNRASAVSARVDGRDIPISGEIHCVMAAGRLAIGGGIETSGSHGSVVNLSSSAVSAIIAGDTVEAASVGAVNDPASTVAYLAGAGVGSASLNRDGNRYVVTAEGVRQSDRSTVVPFRIEFTCAAG